VGACSGKSDVDLAGTKDSLSASAGPTTTTNVTCASQLFQRRDCTVDTQGGTIVDAQVTRDDSPAPFICQQPNTHGFTATSVWVDHGCSAEFQVTIQLPQPSSEQLICSSNQGGYTTCPTQISNIDSIRLLRQLSGAPCQLGQSYGNGPDYVWVDRGCRGQFQVTGFGGPGPGPGPGSDSVELYDQENFNGVTFTVNSSVSNFADLGYNDRAASMIIRSGNWEACQDANFNGLCQTFGPGNYASLGVLSRQISSIRPR
jgi:hypothetical protein